MKATMVKLEFVKDEKGGFVYEGLDEFKIKMIKQAERMNSKLNKSHSKGLLKSFSTINPTEYAESMVRIYGHSFRKMVPSK